MHLFLPDHFISDDTGLFLGIDIVHLNDFHIHLITENLPTTLPGKVL